MRGMQDNNHGFIITSERIKLIIPFKWWFPMPYQITHISIEEKDRLVRLFLPRVRYEIKSEIYGCCIKLLADDPVLRDTWQENFYSMSQNIRSHGRIYVFRDPEYPADTVLYDARSRTLFLLNVAYYGWVKSLALSLTGDILEDEHGIFSLHGACVDVGGCGICLIGASGAGKTTQTYGLLADAETRIVSDDWFFARIFGPEILAFGSEKNFYIRQDLEQIWREFGGLMQDREYDRDGRAVADLRWVIGKGRLIPLTTLKTIVVLRRDPALPGAARPLDTPAAQSLFLRQQYFNPHLLVNDAYKTNLREQFLAGLLDRTVVYDVNTTGTPDATQRMIRAIAGISPEA